MQYMVECETCNTTYYEPCSHMLDKKVWVCTKCNQDACDLCYESKNYHDHQKPQDSET